MNTVSLYRPCVGLALFNRHGKVFVGERIDAPGAWQMPQGGIDPGEDLQRAAFRELLEEIGTNKAEILEVAQKTLRYDLPEDFLQRLGWKGRYTGQEQSWIALRFTGTDSDIDIAAHDPAEFQRWKWVNIQDTIELIVPFKRDVYRQVVAMFGKYSKMPSTD